MAYPSLEQYNEAFQNPQLTLSDPELKKGQIKRTGLGLPLALCGGFALTYTVTAPTNKKYAVRCFHKESKLLEKRYQAISHKIISLKSSYFLPFEFQSNGIRIGSQSYPIVKMAWASGVTLGEFVEKNYNNKQLLQTLVNSLQPLSSYLEANNIAHGDIQPGNVMVSPDGCTIQLIDYDGMYVEAIKSIGSNELGIRNFQHPKRTSTCWDHTLDRFSFISIVFSLKVLQDLPNLWKKTQSDDQAFLFRANDFDEPGQSSLFQELYANPKFIQDAKNFAAICKADFDKIPSLNDFIFNKNIPQAIVNFNIPKSQYKAQTYISTYPVINASDYQLCLKHVGDMVEIIGKVYDVKKGKTKYGKPYTFINFGSWRGNIVKITIWSEGLSVISENPTNSWAGKWISVTGLMEAPYTNPRHRYTHLSITISQNNQLHILTDNDALYRLGIPISNKSLNSAKLSANQDLLSTMKGSNTTTKPSTASSAPKIATSKNEAILNSMKNSYSQQTQGTPKYNQPTSQPPTSNNSKFSGLWEIIITIIVIFVFVKMCS